MKVLVLFVMNKNKVKIWREMNDGVYWAGIIGIQVAGTEMHLNILIRGMDEIHRFYNLCTAEIPIQPTDEDTVFKFVETLLTIRVCEKQLLLFKFLFHSLKINTYLLQNI